MNFGWYEIMDRLAVLQYQIHDSVYEHQEADVKLQNLIDDAQCSLSDAYQYAARQFEQSEKQEEM